MDGNGMLRGVGGPHPWRWSGTVQMWHSGTRDMHGGGGQGVDWGISEVSSNLNDTVVQFGVMVGMGWGWTGGDHGGLLQSW